MTLQRSQSAVAANLFARRAKGNGRRTWAGALVAPLTLLILIGFVVPVCGLLLRAVSNEELAQSLPQTMNTLSTWDGTALPPPVAFDALAADLLAARENQTVGALANRLNFELPGFRSTVMSTTRSLAQQSGEGGWRDIMLAADQRWGDPGTWRVLKRNSGSVTPLYLLAALDLRVDQAGGISRVDENQRLFVSVLGRTLTISTTVTVLTILLGLPTAHLLASPGRLRGLLMFCVLLPFTTSILVRTIAWVLLLQSNGLVIDLLTWLHLSDSSLQLIYNRVGVIVAMTHIQLPYTILPIYAVMRGISPDYYRAAISLGASPIQAFFQVYLPQILPGVFAGGLITFILSLGYYIAPALVGGPSDQMISYYIAQYVNTELNWGQAAALALVLITLTAISLLVLARLFSGRVFDRRQIRLA